MTILIIVREHIFLMKSINKNKPISVKKYPKTYESPTKSPNHLKSQQDEPFSDEKPWIDQMIEFHLHDEEPQSIMAKRKLQEFSVQLNEDTGVNSFKRNKKLNHMHNIIINSGNPTEGWVENQLRSTQKSQTDTASKLKRSHSASRSKIRDTLKIKTQNKKKFSLTSTPLYNNKLNLSFNNLSPFQMETVPEPELSNQLVKKLKSHGSRRPNTALYYGASQKVMTLFEKDCPNKRNKCETIRIHSNKEKDSKGGLSKDNRFLKTFSLNTINKNAIRSKRGSKNMQNGQQNELNQKENKKKGPGQAIGERISHVRTHSQKFDYCSSKDKNIHEAYQPYSQRKLNKMNHKNHILSKRIKSHGNIPPSAQQHSQKQKVRESFNREDSPIGAKKQVSTGKIEASYDFNSQRPIKEQQSQKMSKVPSPNKHIAPLTPSKLQEDFSLLISMLKNESHNIFGGQLHNYLTQMKNNSLYNYYCSGGANRKKNGKLALNSTGRVNRKEREKWVTEHERMRELIEGRNVKRNHTDMNYTGLSVLKQKEEGGQFVRTSTSFHQ